MALRMPADLPFTDSAAAEPGRLPACPGTRVAILQSNYIPWKGYFDLLGSVDRFVLYDDVQYTKNDWRNRNRIKTPQGPAWLTVPVGQQIHRRIRDVALPDARWQARHWQTLEANYRRAACFDDVAGTFARHWLFTRHDSLSGLNQTLISAIASYLGIPTSIEDCSRHEVDATAGPSDRLVAMCRGMGATTYVSGPAARSYLDVDAFSEAGIDVEWFAYPAYPPYAQLWGPFEHHVTILDLLFHCGPDATRYMKAPWI